MGAVTSESRIVGELADDLSRAIVRTMQAWSDEHSRVLDAKIPFAALQLTFARCLTQLPQARRRKYAEMITRGLLDEVKKLES